MCAEPKIEHPEVSSVGAKDVEPLDTKYPSMKDLAGTMVSGLVATFLVSLVSITLAVPRPVTNNSGPDHCLHATATNHE